MATNNATNTSNPITVAQGGTGLASTTAYGLIAGGTTTTGNLQTVTPGAANTLVISGGTAALHAYTTTFKVTSDVMTNTKQPCFLAFLSTTQTNVTGDGTVAQVAYDTVVFDNATNFTTGASALFTAPVTGRYFFSATVEISAGVAATNLFEVRIVATSRTLQALVQYPAAGGVTCAPNLSGIIDMTAGDTCKVNALSAGGTKSSSIVGSASPYQVFFSGFLVC